MATLDNANPTVLSASQLPTRQQRNAQTSGPDLSFLAHLDPKLSAYSDFTTQSLGLTDGIGSNVAEIGLDPIDEQEIYGMSSNICPNFSLHDCDDARE